MVRNRERGNVAAFAIGGLVLLGLLAGAIYVVRNKTPQATNVAQTTTSKPSTESTNSSDKTDTTTTTDPNSDLKAALAKQAEEEKKAQEQQKAQQSEPQTTPQTTVTTTPTTSTAPVASGSSLPTTGPEEVIVPMLGATLLAGVGFAFVRSRALI